MLPTLLTVMLSLGAGLQPAGGAASPQVVFVCEHGAAKSLIATLYFNQLAAERGIAARASFRGVDPQDALAATHIFAIGCSLPVGATQSGKASSWDDVPDDQGYGPMRDAIVRHVRALIDTLR